MKKILGLIISFVIVFTAIFVCPISLSMQCFDDNYVYAAESISTTRYGRTQLTNKSQRYIYDTIKKAIKNGKKSVSFDYKKYSMTEKNLEYASLAFYYDYPEYDYCTLSTYYYQGSSHKTIVKQTFKYNSAMKKRKKELNDRTKEIISSIPEDCDTDYEKALYLHDYLCKNVKYNDKKDGNRWQHSAYGALIKRECVCDGYSRAYNLLLQKAGIQAWQVNGYAKEDGQYDIDGIGHSWNIMWIEGECYYTDVTFDDGDSNNCISHRYFCRSKEAFDNDHLILYSDKKIYKYRTQFLEHAIPECSHDESKHIKENNLVLCNLDSSGYEQLLSNLGPTYIDKVKDESTERYVRGVNFWYEGTGDVYEWISHLPIYDKAGLSGKKQYLLSNLSNLYTVEFYGTKTSNEIEGIPYLDTSNSILYTDSKGSEWNINIVTNKSKRDFSYTMKSIGKYDNFCFHIYAQSNVLNDSIKLSYVCVFPDGEEFKGKSNLTIEPGYIYSLYFYYENTQNIETGTMILYLYDENKNFVAKKSVEIIG